MASPNNALQAGIYSRLTGYSALTTALGGSKVYDHALQGQTAPYVVIGANTLIDASSKSNNKWEATTYSLSGSLATLKPIQEKFGRDILTVLGDALQLKLWFNDLALILRLGIEHGGQTAPDIEVIEKAVIEDIGINQTGYLVMEWLVAATSPKKDRSGNVKGAQAAIKVIEATRRAPIVTGTTHSE